MDNHKFKSVVSPTPSKSSSFLNSVVLHRLTSHCGLDKRPPESQICDVLER